MNQVDMAPPHTQSHDGAVATQLKPVSRPASPFIGIGSVWTVLSLAIVFYLLAGPIRIQYWRADYSLGYTVEERMWKPIREIWWFQQTHQPVFGTELVVQLIFGIAVIVVVAAVIAGLWLILTQPTSEESATTIDAA